ncbi:hypothetical protein EBZ80_25600 [bacterium]|nr:hypothetical protein [Betaproteobacteria bacterium]NDE18295.1 hypothetical protein [bacterium]
MSENNRDSVDDADWLRHAIVDDKIKIAQLENEVKRLRERETALLAAGDKLEQQLVTVARQRDVMRLTDEERKALEYGISEADAYDRVGLEDAEHAAIVFRGLLERLG